MSITRAKAIAFAMSAVVVLAVAASRPPAHAADSGPAKGIKNILLVHGAFADGSSWAKVIPLLQAKGYNVTAVQIPLTALHDDVAATGRALDRHAQIGAFVSQPCISKHSQA